MLNRRSFLQRIGAAAVALTLARHLPGIGGEAPTLAPPSSVELAFHEGDVFTIAGRYALNPLTRQPTQHLQRFVVTADVAEGDTTVNMWPPIGTCAPSDIMPVLIGHRAP